jgi:hypothetical protein
VVVLGALGAGGYVLLGRSQPEAPPGASVTPPVETGHVAAPAPDTPKAAAPAPRPPRRTERPPPAAQGAQGYLTIAADPYGTVYIDGVQIGVTPVFSYGVKPGSHAIRVERAGYRTQSETVQVDPGNTVTKRYTLIQEQP